MPRPNRSWRNIPITLTTGVNECNRLVTSVMEILVVFGLHYSLMLRTYLFTALAIVVCLPDERSRAY
jgi:hypothetical protein